MENVGTTFIRTSLIQVFSTTMGITLLVCGFVLMVFGYMGSAIGFFTGAGGWILSSILLRHYECSSMFGSQHESSNSEE